VIWGGFGLFAVVVVLVVVFAVNGGSGASGAATPAAALSATPVSADTSGGYAQLVERANGLYDSGSAEFGAEHWDQGAAYFAAAAKVYAAAWRQKATDPNVGTDYATSLFYAGDIEKAITQVDEVLAGAPDFQVGWFNKGNYLTELARHAEQDGDAKAAEAAYGDARAAFQKAVSLGAGTDSGQQAQARLDELPQ
jgi:tetratricopeptide (TPR) repeat protein